MLVLWLSDACGRGRLRCWLLFWPSCMAEMVVEKSFSSPCRNVPLDTSQSSAGVYVHTAPALHEEGLLSYKSLPFKH